MSEESKPMHPDDIVSFAILDAVNVAKDTRPPERGELARRYAIVITELEKVFAYHQEFIVRRNYWPKE